MSVDPSVFDPASADPENRALNAAIIVKLSSLPDQWSVPPAIVRAARLKGQGAFPLVPVSPVAEDITIPGPAGPLRLHVVPARRPRGVYLHIHGGGWTFGACDAQDNDLTRLAENCGLTCVSVGYRLAPETPWPAGPDDCEAAALWLAREGLQHFGVSKLAIGGESAGAHLSVVTLLRLRDKHGLTPFSAANLTAGVYDLTLTPSAANWGSEKLILNTRDICRFVGGLCQTGENLRDGSISPLHAGLTGLPPALFTVGTRDPLLDDSLFMSARWQAAGNRSELAVYPGGMHVFTRFETEMAEAALARIDSFLNRQLFDAA